MPSSHARLYSTKVRSRQLTLPKTLPIQGARWRVYRVGDAPRKYQRLFNKETDLGACLFEGRVILLADSLSGEELEETLIHELLHACLGPDRRLDPELEEYLVEFLDRPLAKVLRRLRYE